MPAWASVILCDIDESADCHFGEVVPASEAEHTQEVLPDPEADQSAANQLPVVPGGNTDAESEGRTTYYLPRKIRGIQVMVPEQGGMWLADNSRLKSTLRGIGCRKSMDLNDLDDLFGPIIWGDRVRGEAVGTDWVKCFDEAVDGRTDTQSQPTRRWV
jgi:hypothetical protein